jgi:hypothetical protein
MPRKEVYLEASERTQDLLNIKWALRSAGYTIGSTWHDLDSIAWPPFKDHWTAVAVERLQFCDSLVVICERDGHAIAELAMMAGFALARGIRVFWIGTPVRALADFPAVKHFNSPEAFQKEVVSAVHCESAGTNERMAA